MAIFNYVDKKDFAFVQASYGGRDIFAIEKNLSENINADEYINLLGVKSLSATLVLIDF